MKRLFVLFTILSMVLGFSTLFVDTAYAMDVYPDAHTYTIHEAYVYPVTSDSSEWFATDSHADRVAYCQIPNDILCNMDTMALVQTIAEYPLLVDVLAFNSAEEAYQSIFCSFNAIQELETRADAFDVLVYVTSDDYSGELDWISKTALKMIMLSGRFTATLDTNQTDVDIDYSSVYKFYPELKTNEKTRPNMTESAATSTSPVTPSGNAVSDAIDQSSAVDFTAEEKAEMEKTVFDKYGLRPVRAATVKYNCHSYAWYSQSPYNTWWISYAEEYTSDSLVMNVGGLSNTKINDRITYKSTPVFGKYTHSGIITRVEKVGSISVPYVTSKWGAFGLYVHNISNCPYYDSGIVDFWRIQ